MSQPAGWVPPPPPRENNGLKFLLIGIAFLLVIAISVGATLLLTRNGTTGQRSADQPSSATADVASANDSGPVGIITEDPTCKPARAVFDTLTAQQRKGWIDRDISIPAASWTPEQRTMYQSVGDAMLRASEQLVNLSKLTTHRVMRELYLQSIVYWRAYEKSISSYVKEDNFLALTASNAANAVVSICTTIEYDVAATRSATVAPPAAPSSIAPIEDANDSARFVTHTDYSICQEWKTASDRFDSETEDWRDSDVGIPASDWGPEQRSMMERVAISMRTHAQDVETLGRKSGNPIFEDIATLSAQYWRAFVDAIPTYTTADSYFSATGAHADFTIFNACAAIDR